MGPRSVPAAFVAGCLLAGCAATKERMKKSRQQWVEDCVYERTLPRDQCESMWEQAHGE